jgi:hypothetical protein
VTSSDPAGWASDVHASEVQQLAFDLDEAMGRVLHGATVKFERYNIGGWVVYLTTHDRPGHEYIGTGGSPESALMHAITVCERHGPRRP